MESLIVENYKVILTKNKDNVDKSRAVLMCRHCGLKFIDTSSYDSIVEITYIIKKFIDACENSLMLHLMMCEKFN